MLRKFIQCAQVKERLAMVNEENASAWSSEELNIAIEIVGAAPVDGSEEDKIQAIRETLKQNEKKVLTDEFVSRARKIADVIQESLKEKDVENQAEAFIERMQLMYSSLVFSVMKGR